MAVTKKIHEANVLLAVALNSAAGIQATAPSGGQQPALVSVVFLWPQLRLFCAKP
jgi:hypothetical protein